MRSLYITSESEIVCRKCGRSFGFVYHTPKGVACAFTPWVRFEQMAPIEALARKQFASVSSVDEWDLLRVETKEQLSRIHPVAIEAADETPDDVCIEEDVNEDN